MAATWLVDDPVAVARERILDAAGRCFAERGVRGTSVADVARAAGCSRQTVYRYYADRDALRAAFVDREAQRVGGQVATEVAGVHDVRERLVAAVQAALRAVRSDPLLLAWFTGGDAGTAADVAARSPVLLPLVLPVLGDGADEDAARWLVRAVLSLLTSPGRDEDDERAALERFVVPVVLPARRRQTR